MLPWKSIIRIQSDSKRAIYLQLADALVQEVMSQRILSGTKLPSSRQLADLLQLNRKTILLAYDELLAQGWTEVIPYKGTFIKRNLPITSPKALGSSPKKLGSRPVNYATQPHQINDGTPDYRIAPIEQLYRTAKSLTKGPLSKSVLTGAHFAGELSLRRSLSSYLHDTRALTASTEELLITRGSQMSIYLALSALLTPGDAVIVGSLNYETANETIRYLGGILHTVDVSTTGLDMGQIEALLHKQPIKAIYISPHHHYPTTVTMPIEQRLKLLELSQKHDFYILEDDYDFDYHYSGSPILPIASIDQGQRVLYIGSFSKILAPSIRIGYMYAHSSIIERCTTIRKLIDRRGDPILEKALSLLIEENEIQRSIKKAVKTYGQRRDIFCDLLAQKFGEKISFSKPDGGMAIWAHFQGIDIKNLIQSSKQIHLDLNVDTYSQSEHCRLGFASMTEAEMTQNIDLLYRAAIPLYK
ncbi:hypothetical protein BFP72_06855 [Reichenbachiella sp. 5M10]|uniref:aminotransferase-like domain-containing protein n=1 Tax=Reichenbachiella sp. 5M10 TaxID=1889772 RepID=UPI000C15D8CE|nr:PLP-dependent aminotransferase family protein [Reichenbachiella sp. 5M10]PIB35134.1 hypothetical protein BFP72_06855 [Reichenbachiella sp. 5M10]